MMLREKIRKIFGSKAFFIIFSLLASVTIWLYVAYGENPDVTVSAPNIKVEFINKDYLTDKSLVITKINSDTVSLKFQGKRNSVSRLTSANIKVTANLTEIKSSGTYQLPYTVTYPIDVNPSSLTITGRSTDYISVSVDSLVEKEVQIHAIYDGGVAEGYQAEPADVSPDHVTVSGPKNVISRIDHATVTVMRQNISKTVEDELPIVLIDGNGQQVQSDTLNLSQKTVIITIPVVVVKNVPLTVNLTPSAGADQSNAVCAIIPSEILLSGDAETLGNLNQIVLGTIDLSQFLNTTTQTYKIVIPNGTTNLTGTTDAQVSVTISGLDSKHVITTNIQVSNIANGNTAALVTSDLDIVLRGKTDALAHISSDNIRVVADLSDLGSSTGTYLVLAKIYVDGDTGVGAIGEYKITVEIVQS